jgi:pimeloyl-ACP methyl ester carboxylesterase
MTFTAKDFHAARRFVDTEFGRIAYVERGTGPAALFIHGALLNGYQWRHQLDGLADIRRVIAPDSLAMGYTELRPGQPLGMKNQARMQRAFLDALGIDKVDVVGNDSGGGAAQLLAAGNPGRVRSLTLTNCEVHDYDEHTPASLRFRQGLASGAVVRGLQSALDDPALGKKLFASAYQDAGALPDDAIPTYAAPLVASPHRIDQLAAYVAATTNKDLIAAEPELTKLTAPVLVLWGTADGFFPVKWAYWLRDHLPNVVEVVEVPGAPVFWPEEQPELLNRKLRDLWTRASL